uniref:Polycomb protein Sfmbt n=1 Tax=Lygus hesperus TaxID=30085 RepID=A0A0A9XY93_LYGHE
MDMASAEELGLVWMGDMLLHNDHGGLMINSGVEPHRTFYSDAQQSIEDMRPTAPMYLQDMNGFMVLDEMEEPAYYEDDGSAQGVDAGHGMVGNQGPGQGNQGSGNGSQPGGKQGEERARKIKPVKHPGLKLQTPIAYQRDTDPNVIPIKKDGMAVCEKCGAIGVKHAFYTRERRFCSLACARGSTDGPPPPSSSENENSEETACESKPEKMEVDTAVKVKIHATLPPQPPPPPIPLTPLLIDDDLPLPFPPSKKSLPHLAWTYEWNEMLSDPNFTAASVSSFIHAPMSNNWDNITVGMKVEVENTDCDNYSEGVPDSFWVATVLKIAGYKALLRYEGFGQNESKDFWVNLCSSMVHPVGWCAQRGKPLIPPRTIEDKYKDWKHFLVKRLTGARTLPSNFQNKVQENMRSRFRVDLNLEVVDKNQISQVKVASIHKICGKRLHIKYFDSDTLLHTGFWAHEDSPLIHPVGWAKRVGQDLEAPPGYVDRCLKGLRDKDDATEDLFPLAHSLPYHTGFEVGMKLEAVDPLNLSAICVATIMKVLNDGYLMVKMESYEDDPGMPPGSDWFCYHSSSACILPSGFCTMNGITLTPPRGYNAATFDWADYLNETSTQVAPAELFDIEPPEHGFSVGQRLEAADLMDPRLVCVATIVRIVNRLLKLHFDGWETEYDQWLDIQSPDIYPVGWCELVSHKLEAPGGNLASRPHGGPKKAEGRGRRRGRRRVITKNKKLPSSPLEAPKPGGLITSTDSPASVSLHCNDNEAKKGGEPVAIEEVLGQVPEKDQALPEDVVVKSEFPPPCKKAKVIPRLVDTSEPVNLADVDLSSWDPSDVAEFLTINNCGLYCEGFRNECIDGKSLLSLTKDQIIDLTGKKVGPSLKIFDLIQQLKIKVNPALDRQHRLANKKIF